MNSRACFYYKAPKWVESRIPNSTGQCKFSGQRDSSSISGPVRLYLRFFLFQNFPISLLDFYIRFFFVINFSYFVIRFLLNSSIVKSNNEIGKVNDKKNLI